MFRQVNPRENFPQKEEEILKFWQKKKIFEKSLAQNKKKKLFRFYDGPPFATGLPHYGHILAMAIKDTIVRYKTMRGYYVPRRFGWDCHGLPVENLVEKELGLSGKPEIEKMGMEKFNNACRASVLKYAGEWKKTIERIARWGDLDNVYVTMGNDYIESIWWVFRQIYDKGLIYKGFKSMPYCPRCGTALSNFETNLGYKENTPDPSIYIKFKVQSSKFKNSYLLAWTTTPWTLPGNAALAVKKDLKYQAIEITSGEVLILAESRIKDTIKEPFKVIKNYRGRDLVGWKYEPLFKLKTQSSKLKFENAYKVYEGDFVSTEEGTGIVHIAPAFGEDDLNLGTKENLPLIQTVDKNGLMSDSSIAEGKFVKVADPIIIKDLKDRGLLYRAETIKHTYPFCWRCDTPLIYYAVDTWFVNVTKIRKKLIKNNQKIHWMPEHIKNGRFGKWLAGARDWAISRSRFWGAPLPVWECQNGKSQITNHKSQKECNHIKIIDNIAELEKLSEKKIKDLHRPHIDGITFKCQKCGGTMKRIPEVLDCWFESGSMPYAQYHYPYEMNKQEFNKRFPADFIAEGLDQTRGWFYTLNVISTILFNKPAFYNCIVNGIVLAADGKKLSKRLRNYPEPDEIFNKCGVDSLRWFLLSSPAALAEDVRFSAENVADVTRRVILILWNTYSFFVTYANLDKWQPTKNPNFQAQSPNILDRWISAYLHQTITECTKQLDQYNLPKAMRPIEEFITDFSTWYLRRSRKRRDNSFYQTMYNVITNLATIMAPYVPFVTEEIYQNLRTKNSPVSIHLTKWPRFGYQMSDIGYQILDQMKIVREIVEKAHALRAESGIKNRQPLAKLKIQKSLQPRSGQANIKNKELLNIISEEVNVKEVIVDAKLKTDLELDTKITPELKKEGIAREIIRQVQNLRKFAKLTPNDKINIFWHSNSDEIANALTIHKNMIQNITLCSQIKHGKINDSKSSKEIKIDGQPIYLAIK